MIVYQNTASGFMQDVQEFRIVDRIRDAYREKTGKFNFNPREEESWYNSLDRMDRILRDSGIAGDCGILIEFGLPSTSKRIDFIIAGLDDQNRKNFVIVELKQWTEAESTTKEDVVITPYFGHSMTTHPSYQASSYKSYLSDFNEKVYTNQLNPYSCAYLHNYREKNPEPLKAPIYSRSVSDSPLYFRDDHASLRELLMRHVGRGKGMDILYDIETGNIRPSKQLINYVSGLFKGNPEYVLLEEQKVAYEVALEAGLKPDASQKTVVIIHGGPGTGKSVISMSLLGGFLRNKKNTFFVAPNASFRETLLQKLTRGKDTRRAKILMTGSSKYVGVPANTYDILIVDEAHRLKNGKAFMYQGENQVADIMNAAKVSIFFVDDAQMIRPQDIGSSEEIRKQAVSHNARIIDLKLETQFRCDGAEGFVNWINDVLEIQQTGNYNGWNTESFEFFIATDPNTLNKWIQNKIKVGYNARLLAGYAWPWTSEKDGNRNAQVADVSIPEHNFAMPWNSRLAGSTWATDPAGVHQVGCVHTSQGLEFDFVGIIVGLDLQLRFLDRNGNEVTPAKTAGQSELISELSMVADSQENYSFIDETAIDSIEYFTNWNNYFDKPGKSGLKKDPERLNQMIRNIYRILFTRGLKGCAVYFRDKNLEFYFRHRLGKLSV